MEVMGPEQAKTLKKAIKPGQLKELMKALNAARSKEQIPTLKEPISTSEKWFINFPLRYRGVPLSKFSSVLAIVGGTGELLYVRERNLPREVDATKPTVPQEEAVRVARQHAREAFGAEEAHVSDPPKVEIWVDPRLKGRLAWTLTLRSDSLINPKARSYRIAAVGKPTVLDSESEIYHTHFGAVTGTAWQASPFEATANLPLRDLEVTRSAGGGGSQVTMGEDGRYGFPSGAGNALMEATLAGPHSVIDDRAGPVMGRMKTGTPTDPIDLNFGASGEFETAQVTAFYWTNLAHNLASDILDPSDLPNLPTRVNINSSCNAYWNGSSINFFRAGGLCPNTAYADVVLHEYGHGVDHRKGGILDGAYSEGFSDVMAILGTGQQCLGRDFLGLGTCLRPATTVVSWPCLGCGVHQKGRVYAGFIWEFIQQLQNTFSEHGAYAIAAKLVLAAAVANPSDIPDAVHLSFLADDDDGDLDNGTPHFAELAAAADSRNIPRPPDPLTGSLGYVWANNPTTPNNTWYTPNPNYSYNPSGKLIEIARFFGFLYAVRFHEFGSHPTERGHVQVTPMGVADETCQALAWFPSGTDFIALVVCHDSSGNFSNTRFNLAAWL